jgi:TolA-binding protein
MKKAIEPAALTLGLLACACGAAAAQETVQTNSPPTLEQQVQSQARRIEQQDAQIDTLQAQLEELTRIMGARLDRVETQTESGRVVASNPGPRSESPNARNTFTMDWRGASDVRRRGSRSGRPDDARPARRH